MLILGHAVTTFDHRILLLTVLILKVAGYHGNFLMKISLVTHGYSEWMFVTYITFWNIALIFLAIESCVQVFKIFKEKLDFCIVRPRSYCNIVLLNVHFKKLNWYYCTILEYFIFSSPKLKAQVSFSGHVLSVVCLSVYPSVNFSHFWVLFQNHLANFNETWHKISLGKGD